MVEKPYVYFMHGSDPIHLEYKIWKDKTLFDVKEYLKDDF